MADEALLQRITDLAWMAHSDSEAMPVFCDALLEPEFSVGSRAKVAQVVWGGAPDTAEGVRTLANDFDVLVRTHDRRLLHAVLTVIGMGRRSADGGGTSEPR